MIPPIEGITIVVRSIERVREAPRVDSAAVTYGTDWRGAFVRVPPDLANGIWLEFLEDRSPGRTGPGRMTGTMENDG